jgi:transcriptional regulator with XRE-family HTH domain
MNKIEPTPGRRLKARRYWAGLTQSDLAEDCEVSVPRISELENDKGWDGVRLSTLRRISTSLGITLTELVGQ